MVANILPTDLPLTQGVGSKGHTIYFSESSHVAYQIKADDAGSNLVAKILPTDTPSTQGVGSKGQINSFSESSHVAYYKLKAIEHGVQGSNIARFSTCIFSQVEFLATC